MLFAEYFFSYFQRLLAEFYGLGIITEIAVIISEIAQ